MSSGATAGAELGIVHIAVADPDMLFRGSVQVAADLLPRGANVQFFADFPSLRKSLSKQPHPTLVLIDAAVTGLGGLRGVLALAAVAPKTPFAIMSHSLDEAFIANALHFGATGFVSKALPPANIATAIMKLIAGERVVPEADVKSLPTEASTQTLQRYASLTRQQMRVLGFLADGLLNKQIAYELNVSEATIKAHVSAILLKLNVPSRVAAVAAITAIVRQSA
jgi:DNA-binding NarL/FixJ family response regulator